VFPAVFSISDAEADELNPGTARVCVTFVLPRGSFATIVTRRLGLD